MPYYNITFSWWVSHWDLVWGPRLAEFNELWSSWQSWKGLQEGQSLTQSFRKPWQDRQRLVVHSFLSGERCGGGCGTKALLVQSGDIWMRSKWYAPFGMGMDGTRIQTKKTSWIFKFGSAGSLPDYLQEVSISMVDKLIWLRLLGRSVACTCIASFGPMEGAQALPLSKCAISGRHRWGFSMKHPTTSLQHSFEKPVTCEAMTILDLKRFKIFSLTQSFK